MVRWVMEGADGAYRVDKVTILIKWKNFSLKWQVDRCRKVEEYDEIKEERELTEEENVEYIKLLAAQYGVRKGVKTLNE